MIKLARSHKKRRSPNNVRRKRKGFARMQRVRREGDRRKKKGKGS